MFKRRYLTGAARRWQRRSKRRGDRDQDKVGQRTVTGIF